MRQGLSISATDTDSNIWQQSTVTVNPTKLENNHEHHNLLKAL